MPGQGRHDAQTVDALALGADEGRGNAAIRVGEPLAGTDPTISEWGNPSCNTGDRGNTEGTWGTETSQYPEEV